MGRDAEWGACVGEGVWEGGSGVGGVGVGVRVGSCAWIRARKAVKLCDNGFVRTTFIEDTMPSVARILSKQKLSLSSLSHCACS